MDYKNLHNNYFINYEDVFKKLKPKNKDSIREITFNSSKYYITNIELEEYINNYCDVIITVTEKTNANKMQYTEQQSIIITEYENKIIRIISKQEKDNTITTFDFTCIVLNDFFNINKLQYEIKFAVKKI